MLSANADGQVMMECQTVSDSTPAQEVITDVSTTLSEDAMYITQRTHHDDETSHREETAKKIQYAALEALLHLPSEPVAAAVALARSRVAAGASDSLESTIHAIMTAFTHHRPLVRWPFLQTTSLRPKANLCTAKRYYYRRPDGRWLP